MPGEGLRFWHLGPRVVGGPLTQLAYLGRRFEDCLIACGNSECLRAVRLDPCSTSYRSERCRFGLAGMGRIGLKCSCSNTMHAAQNQLGHLRSFFHNFRTTLCGPTRLQAGMESHRLELHLGGRVTKGVYQLAVQTVQPNVQFPLPAATSAAADFSVVLTVFWMAARVFLNRFFCSTRNAVRIPEACASLFFMVLQSSSVTNSRCPERGGCFGFEESFTWLPPHEVHPGCGGDGDVLPEDARTLARHAREALPALPRALLGVRPSSRCISSCLSFFRMRFEGFRNCFRSCDLF